MSNTTFLISVFSLFRLPLIAVLAVSTAAVADPVEQDFISALGNKDRTTAARLLGQRNFDTNWEIREGPQAGFTPLLSAASLGHWDLVVRMLDMNPNANSDATTANGADQGVTIFWYAIQADRWDLVLRMLPVPHGFRAFTQHSPKFSVTEILRKSPHWLSKLIIMLEMNGELRRPGNPLTDLKKAEWRTHARREFVGPIIAIFRRAAVTLPDFNEPPTVDEKSNLKEYLTKDPRTVLALVLLRHEDPDFKRIPNKVLMELLRHFQRIYKIVEPVEVVAAGVLNALAPLAERAPRKIMPASRLKKMVTAKGFVIDEIYDAVQKGILPADLNRELRSKLVDALTTRTLQTITRVWTRATIAALRINEEAAAEEPRVLERKRERDEDVELSPGDQHDLNRLKIRIRRPKVEIIEPAVDIMPLLPLATREDEANLRATLMQEVIAGAPLLDRTEIAARVDVMMGQAANEVIPMEIEWGDEFFATGNDNNAPMTAEEIVNQDPNVPITNGFPRVDVILQFNT